MNDLIEGLNEVQAEAVVHNEGPLLILSGAGHRRPRGHQIQLWHRPRRPSVK